MVEEPEQRTFTEVARRRQIVGAAIDTIAEVGCSQASLARIAARAGISKGVISYHFAGKDDLIRQIIIDVVEAGRAYVLSRVWAASSGPAKLRAYIESNLDFMRGHRNDMAAGVDILRNGRLRTRDGNRRIDGQEIDVAARLLQEQLAHLQD